MSVKLNIGYNNSGSFKLDDFEYPKGICEIIYSNVIKDVSGNIDESIIKIGLRNVNTAAQIQKPILVSDWVNVNDVPYSSLESLLNDLSYVVFNSLEGTGINTNNATGDAFGRLRVSEPYNLFDSKQLYNNQPLLWDDQEVSGSGTGSSHSTNTASSTISVGAATAGKRVRQTFMSFPYQAGKSQLILMTGTMLKTGGGTGIVCGIGIFNDSNGIFFKYDEGVVKVVIRSSYTGSPVDTEVEQSNWNLDKMDGTGVSKITVDWTKSQIFVIDYEWLGVGRVRVGLNINGVTHYVHEFLNANINSGVYMSTPDLPLRYEIENLGTGQASSLEHICSSVESEGGVQNNGTIRSYNMGTTSVNANIVGTTYALLGLRLKSTNLSAAVKIINSSVLSLTTDNFVWSLRFNPSVTGTFTYNDVDNSSVQIAVADVVGNPSTNTVTGGQIIRSDYASSLSAQSSDIVTTRYLGSAIDGTRDTLVLCVTPLTSNADILGAITWRELN